MAGESSAAGSTDTGGRTAKVFTKDKRPRGLLVLGPGACKAAALCGPPGPLGRPARPQPRARPPPAPARPLGCGAGPQRAPKRGGPRGRQQLVSPRGAAPPFPGTKAAARAGAPRRRAERGRGAGSENRAPEMGHPQGAPPNFPRLQCGAGRGRGCLCRARGERTERARGRHRRGWMPAKGETAGGRGPREVGERARGRAGGGGGKSASWKLTAVVGFVAVGVRLVLGRLGGRPSRAGAGARARAGAVGSEELVDILVVVAGAVGGAAAARAGRGGARGGVRGRSGAGPGVRGQAPREAGEVVGDLLDGPDGAGAHVDGHMLLDADGRLLPAPPEGHAGSAVPPGRGPARRGPGSGVWWGGTARQARRGAARAAGIAGGAPGRP